MIQQLIEHAVKSIVEHTDQVSIVTTEKDSKLIIDIHVASDDIKRVIGKEGRIIRSLRSLANACSSDKVIDVVIES
jgi:uncharacterized protein